LNFIDEVDVHQKRPRYFITENKLGLYEVMKEPLVSELTIPHASPLYHTGNNIFLKYNYVPLPKK
jgi:hypothetical protein